jgi:hypothetical protein
MVFLLLNEAFSAPGGRVDRLGHVDAAVLETDRLFTGAGVLERIHEYLDRVLLGAGRDDHEGVAHDVVALHLLAGVGLVAHHLVDEPLHDRDFGLVELPCRRLAAGVGHDDRLEVDVPLDARVLDVDLRHVILAEQQQVRSRGLDLFCVNVILYVCFCHGITSEACLSCP